MGFEVYSVDDILGPIGRVQSPNGELEFGNVGISNCVYLRFKANHGGFEPQVVYSPEELRNLLTLVEQALKLAETVEERGVLRLGALPPKPVKLQVALVRPPKQSARILLRLLHLRRKIDVVVEPENLYALLKIGDVEGASPLEGAVSRTTSGNWMLAGQELLTDEATAGLGTHQQSCRPEEVPDGTVVRLWTYDKNRVACFQMLSDRSADEAELAAGQRANELLAQGRNEESRSHFYSLAGELMARKSVTSLWAAKTALGVLLAEISNGNDQAAQRVWLGQAPDPVLQMGIEAIESGKVGKTDYLSYRQISAYFHSLNPEVHQAELGVNSVMESVLKEIGPEPSELRRMALSNWYLFLYEVFEGEPPPDALQAWKRESRGEAPPLKPEALAFPRPLDWVEPEELVGRKEPAKTPEEPPLESKPESGLAKKALSTLVVFIFILGFSRLLVGGETDFPGGESIPRLGGRAAPEDLKVSIAGVKFGQTLDSLKDQPGVKLTEPAATNEYLKNDPYWKGRKVLRKEGFSAQFDSEGNMLTMAGRPLEYEGRVIIPKDGDPTKVLGEPAGRGGRGAILYYVYDDGGERFVISSDGGGSLLMERGKGRWREAVPVSLGDIR